MKEKIRKQIRKIIYEAISDIYTDEGREFLEKVNKENPDLYDKFKTILASKGLEKAHERYVEYDPAEIKRKKREGEKQERFKAKMKKIDVLDDLYKSEMNHIRSIIFNNKFGLEVSKFIAQFKFMKPYLRNIYVDNLFGKKIPNSIKFDEYIRHRRQIPVLKLTFSSLKKSQAKEFGEDKIDIYIYFKYPEIDAFLDKNSANELIQPIDFMFTIVFDFDIDLSFFSSKFPEEEWDKLNAVKKLGGEYNYLTWDEFKNTFLKAAKIMSLQPGEINVGLNE